MKELCVELLNASSIDLRAAQVLSNQKLFAPCIYHLQQSLEKQLKSFYIAWKIQYGGTTEDKINEELQKKFSHLNKDILVEVFLYIIKPFTESKSGLANPDEVEAMMKAIERFRRDKIQPNKVIPEFAKSVDLLYNTYIKDFKLSLTYLAGHFMILGIVLVVCLSEFVETATRYPLKKYAYQNIHLLNDSKNDVACKQLIELTAELNQVLREIMIKESLLQENKEKGNAGVKLFLNSR